MIIGRPAKMIMAIAAIAVMLMFSEMNAATLLGIIIGTALIMLGIATYYRSASIVGLMLATASVAISSNPGQLTAMPALLNAAVGLLIPLYVLSWASLSAGSEESGELRMRSRAGVLAIVFLLSCALSVPAAAFILGLVSPRYTLAMSVLTEIAITLAVAAIGIIVLTAQGPRGTPGSRPALQTEPE